MSFRLEGFALLGMAIGVAVMLQPWWDGGMRVGFFVAGIGTIAHIVLAHLPKEGEKAAP